MAFLLCFGLRSPLRETVARSAVALSLRCGERHAGGESVPMVHQQNTPLRRGGCFVGGPSGLTRPLHGDCFFEAIKPPHSARRLRVAVRGSKPQGFERKISAYAFEKTLAISYIASNFFRRLLSIFSRPKLLRTLRGCMADIHSILRNGSILRRKAYALILLRLSGERSLTGKSKAMQGKRSFPRVQSPAHQEKP